MKDCMTLYSLGISAVAPISENCFVSDTQYAKLKEKFKHVFLLYDRDLPGVRASNKIHKSHPDLNIFLIPKKYECKDISDFHKKYGRDKTLELIEEAKNHIRGKEGSKGEENKESK